MVRCIAVYLQRRCLSSLGRAGCQDMRVTEVACRLDMCHVPGQGFDQNARARRLRAGVRMPGEQRGGYRNGQAAGH